MQKVTASEYSKKVRLYRTVAQREPVVIMSHGREEAVLISASEYHRLIPPPMNQQDTDAHGEASVAVGRAALMGDLRRGESLRLARS
jgi:prevent-host-death family protein